MGCGLDLLLLDAVCISTWQEDETFSQKSIWWARPSAIHNCDSFYFCSPATWRPDEACTLPSRSDVLYVKFTHTHTPALGANLSWDRLYFDYYVERVLAAGDIALIHIGIEVLDDRSVLQVNHK